MKKLICNLMIILGLLTSNHAKALPVIDAGNIAQSTISAVQNGLTAASTFATEVKTSIMEAWDKSAWTQQLKGLWDSIQKLQKQIEEVVGLRDDLMNTLSGARDLGGWIPTTSSGTNIVDYEYAKQLPQAYLPTITCSSSGTGCVVTGTGYTGVALSSVNSVSIRNALRVNNGNLSLTVADINKISNEAAERYAQEIAIVQAMAQEAYTQANNRIAKIEELQAKITGAVTNVNTKSVAPSPGQSAVSVDTAAISNNHSVSSTATAATSNQYDNNGNLTVVGYLGLPSSTTQLSSETPASSTSIGTNSPATAGSNSPAPNRNDLKFIADLQAQIQVQQARLINEQNKLAALAILQQSLRDAYEQRKKEIAAYVVEGKSKDEFMASLGKLGVAAAQKASYELISAWYE